MLILSVKASQVLVVPKNVGFSIPRYEPDPNPRLPGDKNVAPVWVGGPLKTLLYYPLLQSRRHGPRAPNAE